MMNIKRTYFFFIIGSFVVISVFALIPSADATFGISPPFLNADHLVAGAKYVQTIYLVQNESDSDLRI